MHQIELKIIRTVQQQQLLKVSFPRISTDFRLRKFSLNTG